MHQNSQTQFIDSDRLPPVVELSDTPFFPQTEHQCGPASLATVLKTYAVDVSPELLSSSLYTPDRKGSFQTEMSATSRKYGMLPYPLKPNLSDVLTEIAAGHPVLVLQNLGFDWWPQWHYAVVIGYDINNALLLLRSGTTKRWQTPFATFARTWNRADNWALVIVPAGEVPATATASVYLKAAHGFEQTGLNTYAVDAYRAATAKWRDDATTWLTLGNIAYKNGDAAGAVSAFLQASALEPETVIIWNNLAYALHAYGCPQQALKSLQCGYQLSPDDHNLRDSEYEIRNMAVNPGVANCPEISCNQSVNEIYQ